MESTVFVRAVVESAVELHHFHEERRVALLGRGSQLFGKRVNGRSKDFLAPVVVGEVIDACANALRNVSDAQQLIRVQIVDDQFRSE